MTKIAGISAALLVVGCAGAQHSPSVGMTSHKRSAACASQDHEPVEVAYRDAPGGGTVSFATEGNSDELRQRVEELAEFHNSNQRQIEMHDLYRIPHTAKVEPAARGARLTLVASATNDADALRKSVQEDVEQMKAHGCVASQEAL